jgi:hypothetical protein
MAVVVEVDGKSVSRVKNVSMAAFYAARGNVKPLRREEVVVEKRK